MSRLYAEWQALQADQSAMYEMADAFLPENRIGDGLSWWEEGQDDPLGIRAPSDLDFASMMLTIDDGHHGMRARPRCPEPLSGQWTLTAVSRDGLVETTPTTACHWVLTADGHLTDGEPAHAGWTWRVHKGQYDDLRFGPESRPSQQRRLILRHDGDRVTLSVPSATRGHEVWRVTL